MNATIQGKKDTYILLSGDLLHQVSELTDTIQSLADSQPQIGHLTSKTHTIIFPVVFTRINAIAKELNGDLSKQVLLNTRLAMGVWPTPKSVSEIKRYSSIIARKSCDIVDLFHSSGYLKIQPTLLSINVNSTLTFQ